MSWKDFDEETESKHLQGKDCSIRHQQGRTQELKIGAIIKQKIKFLVYKKAFPQYIKENSLSSRLYEDSAKSDIMKLVRDWKEVIVWFMGVRVSSWEAGTKIKGKMYKLARNG